MTYATDDEIGVQLRIPDVEDNPYLESIVASVSEAIDLYCDRNFAAAGTVATARVYVARGCDLVETDDFGSEVDLAVATDDAGVGTFDTSWSAASWQVEPLNNLADGRAAWKIRSVSNTGQQFPVATNGRVLVRVTARWGWPAVPAPIHTACLIEAARLAKRRDAPFGVVDAPNMDSSERLLAAFDPDTKKLLDPYRKHPFGID